MTNIARHLEADGMLVFDVFLGLMKDTPLSPAGQVKVGDREYRRQVASRLLPDRQMETTLIFETYVDGTCIERIEERSIVGLTDREEVHHLLDKTGFSVKREFSDFRFTPYQTGDSLLIVEAVLANRN